MATTTEQRKEIRTKLSWPISMWIPEAHRFFYGCSDNVSRSGALLKMPLTVPIRAGSTVEVNFPRTQRLAKEKGSFARIRSGRIVRVDRNNMLKEAKICVAVAFN